mmetsp:Transcript_24667/g.71127  ORF Transcript_24667/g.71127 Transcript_24667/m.71127 type:complete len:582 (-) Transcript_24667:2411-4156(-)
MKYQPQTGQYRGFPRFESIFVNQVQLYQISFQITLHHHFTCNRFGFWQEVEIYVSIMASSSSSPSVPEVAPTAAEKKALLSLAKLWMIGNKRPFQSLLQIMIGLKHPVSVNNLLREMEKKGLVRRPSPTTVEITFAGLQRPEIKVLKLPTNILEHHNAIKHLLNRKQVNIFDVLADGRARSRKEVASILGYPSHVGNFQNKLSFMSNLELILYPTSKEIQLSDMCFKHTSGRYMEPGMASVSAVAVAAGGATGIYKAQSSAKVTVAKKMSQTKHALPDVVSASKVSLATRGSSVSSPSSRLHIGAETLTKKYLRLLLNFHTHYSPGHPLSPFLTPMVLIMLAGNKNKSTKVVAKALKQLTDEGLIFYHGKGDSRSVHLTITGAKTAATLGVDYVPNNLAVLKKISNVLSTDAERKMFDALQDRSSHPRADVARVLGYTCTGTKKFTKTIKVLKGKGLLHFPRGSTGKLQLTDACFPFGKDDDDADQLVENPDDAYGTDTDVESADKKPAAAISNAVPAGPPTAPAIDLRNSDEEEGKSEEDTGRITTIDLTNSDDESSWDPIALANANAAELADGGVFLAV